VSELELDVDKLVPGGLGLARDSDGVVLVRGALPGERVRVRVDRAQKKTRFAHVLAVLAPSPHRVTPDCAHHPRCGGCDLLDLAPLAHATVKEQMLDDALLRMGKLDAETLARARRPIDAPGPHDDARRRRARFVVDSSGALTFSERGAHERVRIDSCRALHPTLDAARAALATEKLRAGTELRVAIDDAGTVSVARVDGPVPARLFGEVAPGVAGGPYVSDASVFSQATRFGGRAILERVLEGAGALAGARVLELFAGSGHLSCALVKSGAAVDSVEGDERAASFLTENLMKAGGGRARRAFIDDGLAFDAHDVLVADPPRTGIPGFAQLLARSTARRLVLVSCDLATGARDLAIARTAGFALSWIRPIDAFPRTSHLETVSLLLREGA
jgi:23S rRNA (uracil1939-C5)-methyltransferase